MAITYLETVLRDLDPKRDVLIYLSSAHAVYGEPELEAGACFTDL